MEATSLDVDFSLVFHYNTLKLQESLHYQLNEALQISHLIYVSYVSKAHSKLSWINPQVGFNEPDDYNNEECLRERIGGVKSF